MTPFVSNHRIFLPFAGDLWSPVYKQSSVLLPAFRLQIDPQRPKPCKLGTPGLVMLGGRGWCLGNHPTGAGPVRAISIAAKGVARNRRGCCCSVQSRLAYPPLEQRQRPVRTIGDDVGYGVKTRIQRRTYVMCRLENSRPQRFKRDDLGVLWPPHCVLETSTATGDWFD